MITENMVTNRNAALKNTVKSLPIAVSNNAIVMC